MRIAVFGYDFFLDAARALTGRGHDVVAVFVGDADNFYNYNRGTLEFAKSLGCFTRIGRPRERDFLTLTDQGCDLLLVMAYQYKVPTAHPIRGLNLHPTILPEGRGVWPLPWLLLEHPEFAGLSLHQLTGQWDAGPIVAQQRVEISATDNLETLSAKLQLAAPDFVAETLENLDVAWEAATPQVGGSTWPMPSNRDRELDWNSGVETVLRVVRAFGKFESTAVLGGSEWMVTDANGWHAEHSHPPGAVVRRLGREIVVAVSDGYVLLRNYHREFDFSKP